jgi:hypothetical protein
MINLTDKETKAVIAALRLFQDALEGREGVSVAESIWRDLYDGSLTDSGSRDPLTISEIDDVCNKLLGLPVPEERSVFRVEGAMGWTFVVCPSRDQVEATLKQHLPLWSRFLSSSQVASIRVGFYPELKRFIERGYTPYVYQYDYDETGDWYSIYYATDRLAGRYDDPEPRFTDETHQYVTTIRAASIEDAYVRMQGCNWSPRGEMMLYIKALSNVHHTSMSVGDVVLPEDGPPQLCKTLGWDPLEPVDEPVPPTARSHIVLKE